MKLKNRWNLKNGKQKLKEKIYNMIQKNKDIQQFETIRTFRDRIFSCGIAIVEAEEDQSNLLI